MVLVGRAAEGRPKCTTQCFLFENVIVRRRGFYCLAAVETQPLKPSFLETAESDSFFKTAESDTRRIFVAGGEPAPWLDWPTSINGAVAGGRRPPSLDFRGVEH